MHKSGPVSTDRAPVSKTASRFSIGEVAARTNVAASALRYYEKEGLIPEPHRVGGKRRYSEDVLARVALIQISQDAGFSLREIAVLLAGVEGDGRGKNALASLAKGKLVEIDETMKRLRLLQRLLTAATSCACPDLDACGAAARRAGLIQSGDQPNKGKHTAVRRSGGAT